MRNDETEIIDYVSEYQPDFERLNRAWIELYFSMEPIDVEVLSKPEEHIIDPGGAILLARVGKQIAGAVGLKKITENEFEFTKMAVDENFRRKGIAKQLTRSALSKAAVLGATRVILYTQTGLSAAVELYRKTGFREVPMETGVYKRSDIKMEIEL